MRDGIAETIYILCTGTSLLCAVMLLRAFARTRMRLLLWSGLCFACLAVNNLLLFIDKVVLGPETDLTLWRTAAAFLGILLLLFGLIWDVEG